MVKLRGLSALEAWTRRVTAGYKDVNVCDLSTSWRDGLAFCALIHHFRPDLIDFDCLSKHNVLYNNRLAFAIAEKHLNVSSLLDAEDMLKNESIDRLSVATYLSQFYECFEGSKSDEKPLSDCSQLNNRNFDTNTTDTTVETTATTDTNIRALNNRKSGVDSNTTTTSSHPPLPPKRDMRCQKCKLRVFILERIIIDDLIYHKSCYDNLDNDNNNGNSGDLDNRVCDTSDDQLNSNYKSKKSLNGGCDQTIDNTGVDMGVTVVNSEQNGTEILDNSMIEITFDKTGEENICDKIDEFKCKIDVKYDNNNEDITRSENHNIVEESVNESQSANNNNAENNSNIEDNSSNSSICLSSIDINEDNKSLNTSIDKSLDTTDISNASSKNLIDNELVESRRDSVLSSKFYPTDKNPFGDDDETEEEIEEKQNKLYPLDLNPFGDEDEEVVMSHQPQIINSGSKNNTPVPVPRRSVLNISDKSPSASLRLSPRKKRAAPTPPSVARNSQISNNASSNLINNDLVECRRDSVSSNVSSELPSSVPSSRAPTPLPRIRLQRSFDDLSNSSQNQSNTPITDKSLDSIKSNESENKNTFGYWKVKKRPAPPIPAVKRVIKGSIAEIEYELNSIGDQLPVIEKKSAELEKAILNRENNDKLSLENDEDLDQFLTTAREKCRLARRQKELMYMKREHKLEEIQADVEYKMRIVMSKQSAQKTEDDQKKEEELLQRLVEIIEERNDIVENMIRDENKEVEEYRALLSKILPSDQLSNYFATKPANVNGVTNVDKSAIAKQQHKKDKHKEKRKHKKESLVSESDDSKTVSPKETDAKKEKHFTLGKSTLKKLGLKPDKDKANKKKT